MAKVLRVERESVGDGYVVRVHDPHDGWSSAAVLVGRERIDDQLLHVFDLACAVDPVKEVGRLHNDPTDPVRRRLVLKQKLSDDPAPLDELLGRFVGRKIVLSVREVTDDD